MSAKKLFAMVLLILMVISISLPVYGETGNLINNPGFEKGSKGTAEGWAPYAAVLPSGVSCSISKDAHTGNASYQISNTVDSDTMVIQNVNVEPDKFYKVSYWLKTKDIVKPAGAANITLYYGSNNTGCKGIITSKEFNNTNNGWQQYEFYIKTLKDVSVPLTLGLRLGGQGTTNKGTVLFDDVSVSPVDSVPTGAALMNFYVPGANSNSGAAQNNNPDKGSFDFKIPLLIVLGVAILGLVIYVELKLSKKNAGKKEDESQEEESEEDTDQKDDLDE